MNFSQIFSTVLAKLKNPDGYILLLFAFCAVVLLPGLAGAEVQRWDEFTNIQVVEQSEGLFLEYNDRPFFEKPPLWYWLTTSLTAVLGKQVWVYRLPSALSATGIVLTIYLFLRNKRPRLIAFFTAACFLLISQNVVTNAGGYFSTHTFKSADLDALHIFLIFLSSILILQNKKYWLISCGLLGLAFLVKGPLALALLILNSAVLWFQSDRKKAQLKILLAGWAAFLLLVLPWHLYMLLNFGTDFWNSYLGYHVIDRSTNELEGHAQTTWFYLKLFFDIRVNPLWPIFLWALIRRNFNELYLKYCLVAVVLVLTVFTIVETKLAWYILPAYPYMLIFSQSVFSKHFPSVIIGGSLKH